MVTQDSGGCLDTCNKSLNITNETKEQERVMDEVRKIEEESKKEDP